MRIEIRRAEDLGLALSEARKARGLTQVQLAEQTAIDRTYLAKLEAGLTTLLLDRSLRLLRRLGARLVVEVPDEGTRDRETQQAQGPRWHG